jgi:hypothetical protein
MHTEQDPLVLAANETILRARVATHRRLDRLMQLYIGPPASFDEGHPAPYGIGHCVFSAQQSVGLISALDSWVRSRHRPSAGLARRDIGAGLDQRFTPGGWPTGSTG